MRLPKLRGPLAKTAMPIGPFRTYMRIKILASGELTEPLIIKAHGFSVAAVAKIEAAGGTAEVI
jgi:ribosomal protein L15